MNRDIASSRLKDVLSVDSINSTQSDFLATHVPFRKITVTNDLSSKSPRIEYISEDEIFNKYFNNPSIYNKHQLIVVDGSSGSGKSHFIRWINAKLDALDENNDVVLMIRRSDNTLKGTIKQFLNIDEVKNIKNKEVYERLVRANQNISEKRFKDEIYYKFIVELENDEKSILSQSNKEKFIELLRSSEFKERMLMAGGPIERIYSKIVDTDSEIDEDVLALFEENDFILDYDFNNRLKSNASRKALKMANKLLPEGNGTFEDEECNPTVLTQYMNSMVETVIKSCAGIEPGDFQQIFKEIRQELYKQGKNLVLLIEDITSCTGINRDLLDALIVEHKGTNEIDKMCRLVSVIGTTSEYFKEFRSNYIDRITMKITIEDGSIGNNKDDLIQFVAKYLNVMSITEEDIENWYGNGAIDEEYPVHIDSEISNWDYYNYKGKKLSLYPFTKMAIRNLYDNINVHKTPRYILRKIIEPAVDNIIQDKKHFPQFLASQSTNLNLDTQSRVNNILANMQIDENEKENYRDRIFALLKFWGNGSLKEEKDYIGGVSLGIFNEFGLEKFAEKVSGISAKDFKKDIIKYEVDIEDEKVIAKSQLEKKTNKAFEDFTKILSDWHFYKKDFIKSYQIRDEIKKFIFATVPWQREGIPLISKQMVEDSSYDLISFERQDRGVEKGLIFLEDNEETYQLLLAFGKWYHIGKRTWNFDNASSSIRFVTSWLENNKDKIIEVVRGYDESEKYPDYIKYAIIAEIYRGIINGDYQMNRISDISLSDLLKPDSERVKNSRAGHSQAWADLVNNIIYSEGSVSANINLLQRYFNLIQGNIKTAKKIIINYSELESVFKELRSNKFDVEIEDITESKIKARNAPGEYLKKILTRIDKVIETEISDGKLLYKDALEVFDFPADSEIERDDIKDLMNKIIEFYKNAESNGINIELRIQEAEEMKEKSNSIAKAFVVLSMDMEDESMFGKIIKYSKNPMKVVKPFLTLINDVTEDVDKVYAEMQQKKNELTRDGQWSDSSDLRFEEKEEEFFNLINSLEV